MADPALLRPVAVACLALVAGVLLLLAARRLTGDLRKIMLWSVISVAFMLVAMALAIAGVYLGDPRFPFYERLATLAALFLFASIVPHIRTHVCVRCSVGDEYGP